MDECSLAERFEAQRSRLRAMAHRILGSPVEAEDALQDAWLRVSRADGAAIDNLDGWFTTIVARVCLNALESRRNRREAPLDEHVHGAPSLGEGAAGDPEQEALLADAVGVALLVVLDRLPPTERLAFVLHDLFAVPFDMIAEILDRSPAAARQLASRARRRVRGASGDWPKSRAQLARKRAVVDAFLAAARLGDFDALLRVLDPDVTLRADATAVSLAMSRAATGAPALARDVRGSQAVARAFSGRAAAAQPALIDGRVGAVWYVDGRPQAVFDLTIRHGKVAAIDLVCEPTAILDLAIAPL